MNALEFVRRVNDTLSECPGKDWNYSRILLITRPLHEIESPFVLWYDLIDLCSPTAKEERKTLSQEIAWGERHSSELGILELVSLRVNRVLLKLHDTERWQRQLPVIRVMKKQVLANQGVTDGIWYEVLEMDGEEFDNR